MNNFLSPYTKRFGTWWERQSKGKRTLLIILAVAALIVIVVVLWSLITLRSGVIVYKESMAAKENFEAAQIAIKEEKFEEAFAHIIEAQEHFEEANENFDNVEVFKLFPQLRTDVEATDDLLNAAQSLSVGLATLATLAQEVNNITGGESSFDEITPEQKEHVLRVLYEAPPDLQGAKANLELAVYLIEGIETQDLHPELQKVVATIQQEVPALETIIHSAIPAAETLPTMLGYPEEKVYLILLQNNNELRPTGGFPGTIGFLKIHNGEIVDFYTENVYNIDDLFKDRDIEPAPEPITTHTGTEKNVLRNINWEPNFPTSALAAREKYFESGAPEKQIDGVIAIDLALIEDLMKIVGPIEAEGEIYTAENFFELLEYNVEFGYAEKGISDADRKQIINILSEKLQEKLFNLPRNQLDELWKVFEENSDQKHIQMFIDDEIVQRLLIEQNWAGEMKAYTSDYIAVIDANLAALKTDPKMERNIEYSVTEENGEYYGTLIMNYYNTTEQITHFYTRYRTYTRFYIPSGSEIVESNGFMTQDKLHNGVPTDPEVAEITYEVGDGDTVSYTVVGGFISIEPLTSGQLRIKYKLPDSVVEDIRNGHYVLHAQKQAGTYAHGLKVHFDIGRPIIAVNPVDKATQTGDNAYSIDWDLEVDRDISINL